MNTKHLLKKLQEYKKIVNNYAKSVGEIHRLRVKSRELLSLLSVDSMLHRQLKKVIKLSNKIRDIDVFFEPYLDSLPKKYRSKLDLQSIINHTDKRRKKKIFKLHLYLESLVIIEETAEFKVDESKFYLTAKNSPMSLNQIELHKYRLFVKKRLYNEKNSFPRNEIEIKILTKIKNILGDINDNINGLNRLRSFDVEAGLFKEIDFFTQEQNLKLFKELKRLDLTEVR